MFGRGIQVPVIVFASGIVGALRPSLGFGVLVEIGVAFDGGHPSREIRSFLEGVERLESTFEGVLHQILRVVGIVGQFHRLPVQRVHNGHGKLLNPRAPTRHGFRFLFSHTLIVTSPTSHVVHMVAAKMALRYPLGVSYTGRTRKHGFDSGIGGPTAR